MKKLLIALTLMSSLVVFANEGPQRGERGDGARKGPKRPNGPRHEEILKKFDKDGDGKLSEEERAAAKAAMKEKMEARRAEVLKAHDKDGDGKLNDEERKAARAEFGPPKRPMGKCKCKKGEGADSEGPRGPRGQKGQKGQRGPANQG